MTDQEQDPQFEKALAYCLGALREDPDAHYKEVRRAARADSGIALKRHVWTAARVQLGLKVDDDGEGDESAPRTASATPPPRVNPLPPRTIAPAPPRPYMPPVHMPAERMPPRAPERPFASPAARDAAPPGDPWRKRPAWAMPQTPAATQDAWLATNARQPGRKRELPEILKQARNPVEFMVGYLQQVSREANFDEVAEAAEEFGFTVYPTTFGRAQAIVGIVEGPQRVQSHGNAPAAQAPSTTVAPTTSGASWTAPETTTLATAATAAPASATANDPLSGLLAFFHGLDQRTAASSMLRHEMALMLHVVEEALRFEAPVAETASPEVPAPL